MDRLLVSKSACHGEWYLSVKISCEVVHITSFSFLAIISQDKVSEPDKGKCGYVCLHMFVFFTLSFCILFSSWFISLKLVLHITKIEKCFHINTFCLTSNKSLKEKKAFSNDFRKVRLLCWSFKIFFKAMPKEIFRKLATEQTGWNCLPCGTQCYF